MSIHHGSDQKTTELDSDVRQHVQKLLPEDYYGRVQAVSSPSFRGRNKSWILTFDDGDKVFLKQVNKTIAGPYAFDRSVNFAKFSDSNPTNVPNSPKLLASHRPSGLLAFEYCNGESLAKLLVDETIPDSFSRQVGSSLAKLHAGPTDNLQEVAHPSPPVQMLKQGISYQRLTAFSLAEISLWSKLQQDQELVDCAVALKAAEENHSVSPVHGDLRLDQYQMHQNQLNLLDWEEFGVGDPARDLGTFAGEWIYRGVLDTVTTRGGAEEPPQQFSEESANQRIAERIGHLVPNIQVMWEAYCQERHDDDYHALASRSVAFLGWHLIDRTIARASSVAKLPGIERAAAGIGRRILLEPQKYTQILGFERSDKK
ncbi:MAG: class V lanthionine synthetase subunit LxmK [Rothia sp. (in: high G+C Gram-positive bacteria)]|nr:class V lanthionine synthetase subunit LxmK [Rothia sp. (in: high G+C Gram-positive bacteria)]